MSDTNISFVRTEMLEEQAPPATQVGAVKWLRENLFSGWLNTLLTLISFYVLYLVLSGLLPWIFGGVWNAGSLSECREYLSAFGKGGHDAACWAVIEDRWLQLLFGFYPSELYWRPILFVLLMFVALAPILFAERVPAKLIYFTLAYPFISVWLLWGGSFWTMILVALGFIAGLVGFRLGARFGGSILGSIVAIAFAVIWWLFLTPMINDGLHRMVGNARLEAKQAELSEALEVLPGQIAEAEAARDAKTAEIAEWVAQKNEIVAQIKEEQPEGADHHEPASPELREQMSDVMRTLAGLRDEQNILARKAFVLGGEQSTARGLLSNIDQLEEREARLPELEAEVAEMENNLPDSVRGLISEAQAEPGTPTEDLNAYTEFKDSERSLVALKSAITGTYADLGRIGLEPVGSDQIGGFLLAIVIGVAGIVLSLPLGIVLALGRQSDMLIVNKSCVFFIEIIRGIPLIVWLFTASLLLNFFLPPGTQFDLMLRVIIMVTLFASAYIAEVIRGGLAALPKGQYEGGDSLGLNYAQSMRLIILPQALKISIPGIVSTFIGLFKDTTLVVFIGLTDPIGFSNLIRADTNWNGIYWELFMFIGACFFIFCFSMSRYSQWLERKLNTGHR